MTRLGDLLRSIMAAGFTQATAGDGFLGRWGFARCMLQRWWAGLAAQTGGCQLDSAEAVEWDGSRSDGTIRISRLTMRVAGMPAK